MADSNHCRYLTSERLMVQSFEPRSVGTLEPFSCKARSSWRTYLAQSVDNNNLFPILQYIVLDVQFINPFVFRLEYKLYPTTFDK
jgi:hypothetical protein